ncbi:hypothetical protein MNBD_GAMMA04-1520 [hydrothermal vent metagenome]|uniref:Uncharacterized protein n=1 Tax=hydrothermal vent metagenome TaxID=652676 RepID=A0A3B0VMY6_9ZZZZ
MNKKLLETYALSVCFVSMGCLSIFSGIFLYAIVEISFSDEMNQSRMYYPPQFYNQGTVNIHPIVPPIAGQQLPPIPEQKESAMNSGEINTLISENSARNIAVERDYMKSESIMSMVKSAIVVLISSIVFAFHWRIAKRART